MTDQPADPKYSANDLKGLAELRKESLELTKEVATLEEIMNKTPEAIAVQSAKEKLKALQENISLLDSFIRRSVLREYLDSNVKPVFDVIRIKIFKVIKYQKSEAEKWAKETNPDAFFKFDEKGFEKYAKAVAETIPVPCVTFEDDPRVEIASDLSMYL
mgnify:CR=1 FL=1